MIWLLLKEEILKNPFIELASFLTKEVLDYNHCRGSGWVGGGGGVELFISACFSGLKPVMLAQGETRCPPLDERNRQLAFTGMQRRVSLLTTLRCNSLHL